MRHTPTDPRPVHPEHGEFPDLIPVEWTQRPFYMRFLLALLGVILIVLGFLGWIIPVIPGFFLVPIGVALIAASSRWCTLRVNALERRMPPRVRRILHLPLKRHRPARTKPDIAKSPAE